MCYMITKDDPQGGEPLEIVGTADTPANARSEANAAALRDHSSTYSVWLRTGTAKAETNVNWTDTAKGITGSGG